MKWHVVSAELFFFGGEGVALPPSSLHPLSVCVCVWAQAAVIHVNL